MRKLDLESFARALLGPRRADAAPEFPATEPWPPTEIGDEPPVWHESSHELRRGMDMHEEPLDTLPGELRELFPKPKA